MSAASGTAKLHFQRFLSGSCTSSGQWESMLYTCVALHKFSKRCYRSIKLETSTEIPRHSYEIPIWSSRLICKFVKEAFCNLFCESKNVITHIQNKKSNKRKAGEGMWESVPGRAPFCENRSAVGHRYNFKGNEENKILYRWFCRPLYVVVQILSCYHFMAVPYFKNIHSIY